MRLTNNIIAIGVSEHGAEMTSLTKGGREYLWNGDERFWNRRAPILFPVVGKPYNNELHVNAQTYPMKQHGFARDSDFDDLGNGHLRMKESSLSMSYPYRLGLEVCYELKNSMVKACWTINNLDDHDAYFQIGAHPGFLLPDFKPEHAINGYVRFFNKEGQGVDAVVVSDLVDGNRVQKHPQLVLPHETPIMVDTFANDALIIEQAQVTSVVLCDRHDKPVLKVDCPQAEAYGIWAPHKEGCPFVCLEPWCGICDTKDFSGDISTRQYIHRLSSCETYTFVYTIEIY